MKRNLLIVVDMQKDFIDGALGTHEAEQIVPAAKERILLAAEKGETVICTMDTHQEDYLNTAEGKKLPVPHCIKDTEGWQINGEIAAALPENAIVVEKPTFGSLDLPQIIEENLGGEVGRIELIGLCTDICVVSNALILKANFPEAQICVNAACCAGVTPGKHQAALETMQSCQIEVL